MSTADRLPTHVEPRKYTLHLRPDLESFTFEGEEEVEVRIHEPTDAVVVNATELEIGSARLSRGDGKAQEATAIELDEEAEQATFRFAEPLAPGPATLAVRFTGILNDQLRGFYRSEYTSAEGETRYMATTQFEATDARRAFPCWDEPAFKAAFQVSLTVPEDLVALSNTPVEEEGRPGDGTRVVRFEETPPMSTYLLAFIIGDLAAVESHATGGTRVRVWAVRGREELGRFALENGVQLLSYLNDYFGIPYPLPKLDHVAIPDFAAGAMENWGLITYRERLLLYDPDASAALTKQHIVEVMAHELAHMWFGDLVTMAWWDDLWLNESFASWLGNKATAALYPEWQMWTQFLFQDTAQGLDLDGLESSHPIEVEVRDPAEIREIFDNISYNKGAAILWMLEGFLGERGFQRGLQKYMTTHEYGNARGADLWKALGEATGEPVPALMATWVKQMGFPLLRAESIRTDGELQVRLRQERFLYPHLLGRKPDDRRWKVPVRIRRAAREEPVSFLLEDREATHSLGNGTAAPATDWWKANAGQTGFYRVLYPEEEWERLRRAVAAKDLPPTDRLGLQNDAYALTEAGYLPATLYLSFTEAYEGEMDATVWRELAANFGGVKTNLAHAPYREAFDAYVRRLARPTHRRMGWDPRAGDGHLDVRLRNVVLRRLGFSGDREILEEAGGRFQAYLRNPASLRADLREVVYHLAARDGDRDVYDALWQRAHQAELNEEKVRLLTAVGQPRDEALLQETLERSLTDEVRPQDAPSVITTVGGHRLGRPLAWAFIKENWAELVRRYGTSGFLLRRLVYVARGFTTQERVEDVEGFFRDHPTRGVARAVDQTLETIRLRAAWLAKNGDALAAWFAEREA